MKSLVSKSFLAGAVAVLGLAMAAQASPTITLSSLTDQGSWQITTFDGSNAANGTAHTNLVNPYGVPPGPTITPLSSGNGWVLTFDPTADFMAYASNTPTSGEQVQMKGKVDFTVTLSAPAALTFNVYEDGIYATSGNGTVHVASGIVVDALNSSNVVIDTHSATSPGETRNGLGGWTNFVQTGGFDPSNSTYHIAIDNDLFATAFASQTPGSGYVAKKDFSIIITTDGSNGGGAGTPEPASLGMLALGGIALLARRRRA